MGSPANISAFGVSLFSFLAKESPDENVLVSPIGIALALALVLAGATPSGTCQAELQKVLGVSAHSDIPKLNSLLTSSSLGKTTPNGVDLTTATSIWTRNAISPSYVKLASEVHSAEAQDLPNDYKPVDDWISKSTHGLIKDVLKGPVDPLTVAVLLSVVHFKGSWTEQFEVERTREGTFYPNKSTGKPAKFMTAEKSLPVYPLAIPGVTSKPSGMDNTDAWVLKLDYGETKEFCALFILPPEDVGGQGMAKTVEVLTSPEASISALLPKLVKEKVHLQLPRFRAEYGVKSLKEALESLGVKAAFTVTKDGHFNAMTDDPDTALSDVVHKAVVEVTEEGTVAAAATAAIMMTRAMPLPPLSLNFNRPFLMAIVHEKTGTPLFWGKFEDPELLL